MKLTRRQLGQRGEEVAERALIKQGYQIVARNYRTPQGEVDIIARQGKDLVFIEVKTRQSLSFGEPQEAVSPHKQARLKKVASYYLMQKGLLDAPVRFDVVAITWLTNGPKIEIIPAAFGI